MKALVTLSIIAVTLVGCGKAEQTEVSNEIGAVESAMTDSIEVAEVETSTQEENDSQEVIAESEAVAETEIVAEETTGEPTSEQTEEPTTESTEEPTPEPTEEPTSTPEPVHEHSYSVTVIKEATCRGKIVYGGLSEAEASGEKLYSCSCGHSYTETISPIFCESDGIFVTIREASCRMEGEIVDHCKHCGIEMLYKATPMTEHIPTIRVDVPEDGKWFIPCEYCGTTVEWGYLE